VIEPLGASRARVRATLAHQVPDRIPFDLGGSRQTGIDVLAHGPLRAALGLPLVEPRVGDLNQQLAEVEPDLADALGCDVGIVMPGTARSYRREMVDDGLFVTYRDEWGTSRRMPSRDGLYLLPHLRRHPGPAPRPRRDRIDILNPVQVSAAGTDTAALKREFGRDLVFWGGGVDTQGVLAHGSPDEVRVEVRRRIADLRDGGGFVFAAVHNVQANVPAANLVAMWEAWREVAPYG
jgi:hypothetical protein